MFCNEKIVKVYIGVRECNDFHAENAFLDCYHDIAFHCTKGYRLVLETASYAISLSYNGVIKEQKNKLQEEQGEWLREGIEHTEEDEEPFVSFESILFVGERLLSVTQADDIFLLQFDDFTLKLVPHPDGNGITGLRNCNHFSYNYVLGCRRYLKSKCPHCGGDGEILLDFVDDYVVRCKQCKKSTIANMELRFAIEDWNDGDLQCDLSNITIE